MRSVFLILALSLLAPLAHAKTKTTRKPADSKASYRAVSLSCREESGEVVALGLAHLAVDLKNSDTGFFGLTLYVRTSKGQLSPKTLNGAFTTVPDGYVLKASWPGAPGDQLFLHLHPRDKTILPGVSGKLSCATDGQVEQL
jgi:hypothetical protein